jgi:hypothetical protein
MSAPNQVGREVLLAIQGQLLNRFGGLAGVRVEGLLDSAINNRSAFMLMEGRLFSS